MNAKPVEKMFCTVYIVDGEYVMYIDRNADCVAAFRYTDPVMLLADFVIFTRKNHWAHFSNTNNDLELAAKKTADLAINEYHEPGYEFLTCWDNRVSITLSNAPAVDRAFWIDHVLSKSWTLTYDRRNYLL